MLHVDNQVQRNDPALRRGPNGAHWRDVVPGGSEHCERYYRGAVRMPLPTGRFYLINFI
jgi:hypothetical protein